jgi:uncharacterized protein YcbX
MTPIGRICELARYPIKSMAGTPLASADLGLHGIEGDRRFAFRRVGDSGGFPFLTAGRFPELLTYQPIGEPMPTHVRTPSGEKHDLWSAELQREVAEQFGSEVELMHMKHGIFDDSAISVITSTTIAKISEASGVPVDTRRFRANVVIECQGDAFFEDQWIGGTLMFGNQEPAPAVRVTVRDVRCSMINLDPNTAERDPRMLKTVVRLNDNNAGVYGTVVQTGTIRVGDPVRLELGGVASKLS